MMVEKSYLIRRGRLEDASQLAQFAANVFLEVFGPDNDPTQMDAHLAASFSPSRQASEIEDPDIVTLIVENAGAIIGYAQMRRGHTPPQIQDNYSLELWRFYVDAAWRGTGLAQDLMQAVFENSRNLGGRSLWLSVWEHNPRAIAFYRKSGFDPAGELNFFLGTERQTDLLLVAGLGND